MEHESVNDINCSWSTWNDPKRLGKIWKSEIESETV